LYYTASCIITPIGGRPVHGTAIYRCDDTEMHGQQNIKKYPQVVTNKLHGELYLKLRVALIVEKFFVYAPRRFMLCLQQPTNETVLIFLLRNMFRKKMLHWYSG